MEVVINKIFDEFPSLSHANHPLIQHKISSMRDETCAAPRYGFLLRDCGLLMGYEATRGLKIDYIPIQTPRGIMDEAPVIADADPVIVAVLRAGLTMAEGLRDIFHTCKIGHIGLSRYGGEPGQVVRYYSNLPLYTGQLFFVVDPVIATGRTISTAIDIVMENGVPEEKIIVIALIAAEEGIRAFARKYPQVRVYLGACDPRLDGHQYVVPGVGDMGDRLFGTT